MTKLKIKDEAALINIFKTISWLDHKKWNIEDNHNFVNFYRDDLTNCEKILTHWICYITDRQMPFEIVWDKGGYVFSELIYEYSRNGLTPKQILDNHYEEYSDKGEKRFRFKSNNGIIFASRYVTDDYQNILQTLQVLDQEYNRSIVKFIINIMQKFQDKNDLLIRIACGLHLLTYQLKNKKANHDEIITIIGSDEQFESKLNEFKRTSTNGKKRLWCCVRDYKKGLYHEIFINALKEVYPDSTAGELINRWKNLPMDQIELPGDVWNNSPLFRDNLFKNVLDLENVPNTWGMAKIIRELYTQLNSKNEIDNFYPEQFDITFDFVPRMCNKKLCNVCLFGRNGVDSICIPTEDKYCPVALLSCGYVFKCNKHTCLLKENISKGICNGGLR